MASPDVLRVLPPVDVDGVRFHVGRDRPVAVLAGPDGAAPRIVTWADAALPARATSTHLI